jgi:hypothetical protein
MADLSVGRFSYVVIFSPEAGNVQIFSTAIEDREISAWEMDLMTGAYIKI